ncbi:MAG: class I SAM-dependent methyltransferase [Candidatus Hodarchaeota archaeon]
MSYWESVWKRMTTNPALSKMLGVAQNHTKSLMAKHVVPFAENPKSICELGCGSATGSLFLASLLPGVKVFLIDLNERILKIAEERFKDAGMEVETLNIDIFTLDFKQKFDIVHSGGLLEHFDNPEDVLNAHVNFTKKGGISFISIPRNCWYWNGFIFLMKLLKREFVDQKNYKTCEFIEVVKNAYKKKPDFKVVDFSCEGIDITLTTKKMK